MASSYPGGLDSFPTNRTNATITEDTHPADHNNANDAINKIEAELGVNPSSSYATVNERLAALAAEVAANTSSISSLSSLGTHASRHVSTGADPLTGLLDATARSVYQRDGSTVGTRRAATLNAGSGITIAAFDDPGNERVVYTISLAGGTGGGGTTVLGVDLPGRIEEWTGVGNTYYVDDAIGNDANTETQAKSEATPWKTIQHAINTYVLPSVGHVRILVKNGTYRAASSANQTAWTAGFSSISAGRQGSSTQVVHLLNYPGHAPVIQEPASTWGTPSTGVRRALFFDNTAKFIRVRGFTLSPAAPGVVQQYQACSIHGGTDIEIDQCIASGWYSGAHASARSQGFYCDSSSARADFYNCVIHTIGNVTNEAAGLSHGFYVQGSAHIVANCAVYDIVNGFGYQAFPGPSANMHVVNSLFANCKKSGGTMDGSTGAITGYLRNNIFYGNVEAGFQARNAATVTAQRNIAFANGATFGNWYAEAGGVIQQLENIAADPLFQNYAARNFRPQSSSPAYNAGVPGWTPPIDIDRLARSVATIGPHRGAQETA